MDFLKGLRGGKKEKTLEQTKSPFTERRQEALRNMPRYFEDSPIFPELEEATEKIIQQLTPDIQKGSYSLIIGEDASGRLPTFIVGHILKALYEHKGLVPPVVRYIAGSRATAYGPVSKEKVLAVEKQVGKIKTHLAQFNSGDDRKVLVITDTVSSGDSIKVLLDALDHHDLKADVATIALLGPLDEMERKLQHRIIYGAHTAPQVYGKPFVAGVTKKPEDVFAKPQKGVEPDKIRAARAVGQRIANHIIQKYLEGKL